MPIHEYTCRECGRPFEMLVRSDTVVACPHCRSAEYDKKLSVFAIASATPDPLPTACTPCGSCGHPDGPGSCSLN